MLVETIIEQLQKMPTGTEVCLYDWRMNISDDIGDGSSIGIYSNFEISLQTLEAEFYNNKEDRSLVPWVAISFKNNDYNDDGFKVNTK